MINDSKSRVTFVGGSLDGTTRVLPDQVYDFNVQVPVPMDGINATIVDFESVSELIARERYLRHSKGVFMISTMVDAYKRATKSRRPS